MEPDTHESVSISPNCPPGGCLLHAHSVSPPLCPTPDSATRPQSASDTRVGSLEAHADTECKLKVDLMILWVHWWRYIPCPFHIILETFRSSVRRHEVNYLKIKFWTLNDTHTRILNEPDVMMYNINQCFIEHLFILTSQGLWAEQENMLNIDDRNITMSEWCTSDNSTEEDNFPDSVDVDMVIEGIIVPLVGTFGIAGDKYWIIFSSTIYAIN